MFKQLSKPLLIASSLALLAGCTTIPKKEMSKPENKLVDNKAPAQHGDGKPFELLGTQVWDVPDPVSGRTYQLFVSLPSSYARNPDKQYPVLYMTDAYYTFPVIYSINRRISGVQDFILVGISYNKGEDGGLSRRRDYTPTASGAYGAPPGAVYGGAKEYRTYIRNEIFPFIESKFRADKSKRIYAGHSYGGLFGAQILLNEPDMFSGYILGSPSLWYDNRFTFKTEEEYAKTHKDLPANVFVYIGEYERPGLGDEDDPNRYDMVKDTNDFDAILKSRNYPSLKIKSEVLNDEDHMTIAPRGYTHALQYMLPSKPPKE